jgi:hypothetical protein
MCSTRSRSSPVAEVAAVQVQHLFTHLFDAPRDPESVLGTKSVQRLQDHQIEGALQNCGFFGFPLFSYGHRKEVR